MHERDVAGSIVTLMCDRSDRYETSFCDGAWLREQSIDPSPYRQVLEKGWDDLVWLG
jgi:cysteine synthase A